MSELIRLTEIPAEELRWRNELLGTRRVIDVSIDTDRVSVQFSPHPSCKPEKYVRLSAGDLVWMIGIADWDELVRVCPSLGVDILSDLEDDIFNALLEAVFQSQLDWMGERIGTTCEIDEVVTSASVVDEDVHEIGLRISLSESAAVSGAIVGDTAAIAMLCDLAAEAAPTPAIDPRVIPLVAAVEIGMTQVSAEDLQRLKVGDVVMMDVSTFEENRRALLRFPPSVVWKATVADESLVFEEPVNAQVPTSVGDGVHVNVVFELGRVTLTVEQFTALAPSASIPLAGGEQVALSSEGQAFAQGEMVKVGEQIGVRIGTLSSKVPVASAPPEQVTMPTLDDEPETVAPEEISESGEPV